MAHTVAPGLRATTREAAALISAVPARVVGSAARAPVRGAPAPSHADDRPRLVAVDDREGFARRAVGLTALFGTLALMILLGLAFFHNVLARGQFELSQLDEQVQAERDALLDRRFELERLTAPSAVGALAEDRLGMVPSAEPVDVVVAASVVRAIAGTDDAVLDEGTNDWSTLKPLLADP